jgi:hypothetical protein
MAKEERVTIGESVLPSGIYCRRVRLSFSPFFLAKIMDRRGE